MENAPLNSAENDPDKKPDSKKKKKNAEALGVFAVEPGASKVKSPERPDTIWDKLTFTKRKHGETEETVPLAQMISEAETRRLPEATEAEAEAETLSEPEERFAERTIVEARQQADPISSVEQAEGYEAAAAEAVELFRGKVIAGGESVEQAFSETLRSLGAEAPAESQLNEVEPESEAEPATGIEQAPEAETSKGKSAESARPAPQEDLPNQSVPNNFEVATGPVVENHSPEAGEENTAVLIDETETPAATPDPIAASPPLPPRSVVTGNYLPPVPETAPPITEKEVVPYYNNEDLVGAAFLGGIVGYLIGRRRGRIKTERKLKPIQKKLERQVEGLERDIAFKEAHIGKVARQQARERQHLQHFEQTSRYDQRRIEALEANQLHGKKATPERIGRVLVTAEEKLPQPTKRIEKRQPKLIDKRIETMSRAELLNLSEKITVENTTLRQIYETHLVGEQGMRRLVSEYSRGDDVKKALRQELVEHEIDFERDPMLRDHKRPAHADEHGANRETLESLLEKASLNNRSETHEELAVLKARQAHQEAQRDRQQKRRRLMDVSMIAAITTLFILVVLMLLRNG